jgi:hypothetical protein
MIPENFCGFKTAYVLPINVDWAESIADLIVDDNPDIFKLDSMLLPGWEFKCTGISGAAGFILEFAIEHSPFDGECQYIEKAIMAFGGDTKAIQWLDNHK